MVAEITFGDLVASYRGKKRWTQEKLAAKAGTSPRTISNIETGKRPDMGSRLFRKLIELLDIPWAEIPKVIPQEKPVLRHENCNEVKQAAGAYDILTCLIPIIDTSECGKSVKFTDEGYLLEYAGDYEIAVTTDKNAFYARAGDNSMSPKIEPGDLVLVEPNAEIESGNIVFARTGQDVFIRKFHKQVDGKIWLTSFNADYPPIEVLPESKIKCHRIRRISREV